MAGVYEMDTHVESLRGMYREQLERHAPKAKELAT